MTLFQHLRIQLSSFIPETVQKYYEKEITFKRLLWAYKKQIFSLVLVGIGVIIFIPIITYFYFVQDISSKARIISRNNTGVTLLDRDGKPFFTFYQPKTITYTTLSAIPLFMQHAVVAAEDKDFYTNQGISLRGTARALITDITTGHLVQGGSTISQELVKTSLLNSRRSFLRKYQEAVLAYALNKRYSKNDILELYLNDVYFGEGSFGVENAAQAYFSKDAKDLTLGESAMLAGILPAPSAYSPLSNNPSIAEKKEDQVLSEMETQGYITHDQGQQALSEKLIFHPKKEETNNLAPHFAIYVRDLLIKKYGEENIIRSGFQVKTTLNSTWQAYAETVVKNQVQYLKYNNASNSAAVVMDPKTGEIAVMVGSEDWENPEFGKTNMAITPRQPGSSFKPIVYSYALQNHLITADTLLKDEPIKFPDGYAPLDYDKRFRGDVTVRRALDNSLNIPAVEVMQRVGVPNTVSWAKNLGITTLSDPSKYGLSLVLGAAEVPLLQMTDVYAAFANKGMQATPMPILEIHDKYNKLVDAYTPQTNQVMDEGTAYIISSILSDNNTRAEEFGNALTISRPAAVKTGTTENFRDALTIGYTPSLVVGVWVGNNDNSPMDNIAGSLGAAPIWRKLMEKFLFGTSIEKFVKPPSIVEQLSCPYKSLANNPEATASAYMEVYLSGTQPKTCGSLTPTISQSPTSTPGGPTPTPLPTTVPQPTDSAPTPVLTSVIITVTPTPTQSGTVPTVQQLLTPTLSPTP